MKATIPKHFAKLPAMILELQQWGAPPVLMLLILLLNFNAAIDHRQDVQFCEVFAGQGEVTKSLRALGLKGTCHDISYSHEYMDLTSTAGFLFLTSGQFVKLLLLMVITGY